MIHKPEINGTQPNIEGHICEELLAEEHRHSGMILSPANVVHLRFGGSWYRLYFDWGTVFWRESQEAPAPYQMPELASEIRIVDLGVSYSVRGSRLEHIETKAIEDDSEVAFRFSAGRTVRFRSVGAVTIHAV